MTVLFYTPYAGDTGKKCEKLRDEIESLVPVEEIEIYRTKAELSQRLHQPRYNLDVCILCAPNRKAFSDILSLRELLEDLLIILLLPDSKKDTITKGHTLRPRFLSYVDGNPDIITAVLKKMLTNYRHDEYERYDEYGRLAKDPDMEWSFSNNIKHKEGKQWRN